ncbi:unnamed protein product [Dicrocoelium dendriticum]|nr:unnamed protein product [Dicrocoelium dendriticum]
MLQVIVVDTNGLWNYDIFDLWRHFDNFNENQLFALAWEQQSPEPDCKHLTYKPIPPHGLNDDVVLLHLQRMRAKGWDEMRSVALSTILGERGHLGKGGQDIFNTVVNWFPQIYYQLPCEWNTQLHSKMVVSCCPTVWPDRLPDEVDCITLSSPGTLKKPSLIRLASLNLIVKQEDPNWNGTLTNSSQTGKMVTRFTEVYSRFRAIPMDCLI